ncbi:MAG: hypothetical protein EOO38_25065 [Cytophagaceae bacterium]|nr:MAG: hypothetical protein EOO38_25065 [Cytophagaceae bacterium]
MPERWVISSCDRWGSSHQIFHVLVVIAALLHLCGLRQALDIVHATAETCRQ